MANRFRNYVDPKLVDYVTEHPEAVSVKPRPMRVDFIMVAVRDEPLDRVTDLLARLFRVVERSPSGVERLRVEGVMGPTVTFTFQTWPGDKEPASLAERELLAQQRRRFVSDLSADLGQDACIFHGRTDALVGDFGTTRF